MNRKPNSFQKNWVNKKLQAVRQQVKESVQETHNIDRILHAIDISNRQFAITKEDEALLDLVINDALNGVDVTLHYPDFYKKLLVNNELRQIFLETLELLEKNELENMDYSPEAHSNDLSFLKASGTSNPTAPPASNENNS